MTDSLLDHPAYAPGVVAVREHPEVERLELMLQDLGEIDGDPGSDSPLADAHRINLIKRLEALKAAAAAAKARVTVAFEAFQLASRRKPEYAAPSAAAGSATRSRWRGDARPHKGLDTWGSPRRWPRCPTPWPC
jgi:hypothetical protein